MIKHHGRIVGLFWCAEAGEPMRAADQLQVLAGVGLQGDRYATGRGAYSQIEPEKIRHLSLITQDGLEIARDWQRAAGLEAFTMEQTRRNVLVHELSAPALNALVGQRFWLGDIECYGVELCTPCPRPAQLSQQPGFEQAFEGRGGLRVQALGSGWLRVGDSLRHQELVRL